MALRVHKQCENAMIIASYLSKHSDVEFVNFPGLEDNIYHNRAKKYLDENFFGSVFTFGLKGDRAVGARFVDNLELFSHVANVGDLRSLVIHPATTTHSQLSAEQLKESGINEQTIRLSIGIESPDDLISDLDKAIKKALQ
jgi:O-acetylhomoserine sulfhydrylase